MTIKKIAFLFLTIKNVNFPNIWNKFFFGNENKFTIYIHAKYPNEVTWYKECIIKNLVETEWGLIVKAYIELLKEAIKDKQNYKFIFLSESCIPIQSFNNFYKAATYDNLSWIKLMPISNYDYNARLNKLNDKFIKHYSRCMLSRYHVNKLLKKEKELDFFYKMRVGDEFYLSVLVPLTKIKDFPVTFDDWEYIDKLRHKIKKKIKKLYDEQETFKQINNTTKIKKLQEEFNNISKNPKTIIDVESDFNNIKKCQSFFYRKFDVKSNIEKYWDKIIEYHKVFINYYDKDNSKNLIKTIKLINKYDNTPNHNLINNDFDWLLKNKNKNIYKKINKNSWTIVAYNILTNPKYKPNIQKLNKLIKYKSPDGIINTLNTEFAEQILSNKYILPNDCVLEIGSRFATVSNVINMNLHIKTDHVSVDADLSIKKYHEYNKEQYKNKISTNTYHSFFGIIDNTKNNYYLIKKESDTYGNMVVSHLKDNNIIISLNKEIKYSEIKNNQI